MVLQLLRDPLWATVLSFLVIVEAIVIYFLQAPRTGFSYEVIEDMPLVSVNDEFAGRLKVLYDEKPIQNVRVVSVKIANSGNAPISAADFHAPLSIEFAPGSHVLTAEVIGSNPPEIAPQCRIHVNGVLLEPVLWNGGDSLVLKCLVAAAGAEVTVGGRIRGVKSIQKARPDIRTKLVVGAAAIPLFVGAFLGDAARNKQLSDSWHVGQVLTIFGALIFLKAIFDVDRHLRANRKLLVQRSKRTTASEAPEKAGASPSTSA